LHTPLGMTHSLTCGRGLAEHAALPAKLADLVASMAENLVVHMKALDEADEHARAERDAYVQLANDYRRIAAELQVASEKMAAYRDLPPAKHDVASLASLPPLEAFEDFVKVERELLSLLETSVERDQQRLIEMVIASSDGTVENLTRDT
jgi:hypothetical protein